MDWNLAIEKNREALRRILAMLVAMVGAANGGRAGGQFTFFPQTGSDTSGQAQAEKSKLSPALPRHLHRFVLSLLRPAEAAARRLIIIAARGLVVELPPPRTAKPKPQAIFATQRLRHRHRAAARSAAGMGASAGATRSATLSLPLFDPLKRFGVRRVKPGTFPRISFLDSGPFNPLFHRPREPHPVPLPRSPDDMLDARRLHRRLEAVGRALDDLPHQAKRLARWRARLERANIQSRNNDALGAQGGNTGGIRRLSPMRPGHPPGWCRRPTHVVDEVLNELHGLAVWARESPDTS